MTVLFLFPLYREQIHSLSAPDKVKDRVSRKLGSGQVPQRRPGPSDHSALETAPKEETIVSCE